jgi:hypothetical protein
MSNGFMQFKIESSGELFVTWKFNTRVHERKLLEQLSKNQLLMKDNVALN